MDQSRQKIDKNWLIGLTIIKRYSVSSVAPDAVELVLISQELTV
jgi:hypothetical protein